MPKPAARSTAVPSLAKLQKAAKAAATNAYAPYSGFHVGAAIWTDRGLFTGANVENASYGLTNCAERTAIFAAAAAGARRLSCVVVYTPTPGATAPCGACRQVIYEFGGPEARVISCCDAAEAIDTTCDALLPGAFGPADLEPIPADHRAAGAATTVSRKAASKRSKKTS